MTVDEAIKKQTNLIGWVSAHGILAAEVERLRGPEAYFAGFAAQNKALSAEVERLRVDLKSCTASAQNSQDRVLELLGEVERQREIIKGSAYYLDINRLTNTMHGGILHAKLRGALNDSR